MALCVPIMNTMMRQHALTALTLNRYKALCTFPVRNHYPAVGFDLNRESFEALSQEFVTTFGSPRHEGRLYRHTRRTLEHVKGSGKRQSLLSA